MSSENDPEFDDSHASAPEDVTENMPVDPGKTWVPSDREANYWADTGTSPDPLPETDAGSRDGKEPSEDDAEEPASAGEHVEPPRHFGEYELLGHVGRGGMGIVYKARDQRLDRIVALKILKAGTSRTEQQVERFVREAKAAARLDHPNIVPCYEFGEFRGWHYLTMAFVDGESLQHRLQRGPMRPREAALMVQALASAVSHSHKQGVIHRDIKPGNVLLGEDGRPRLTDFGIAKIIEPANPPINPPQLTMVGQALGTPGYMAPEQSAGRRWEIGPAVDIYALGGVLVAALTGHPASGDSQDTLAQDIPQALHTICNRCLAYNPLDRYRSADALLKDLEAYQIGETLPTTIITPSTKETPPSTQEVTITLPEVKIKISKSKILLISGFILAVLICSLLLATWITDGWSNWQGSPPGNANGFGAADSGSDNRRNSQDGPPVRSHMEVLIDRDAHEHRLGNGQVLPLLPGDKVLVDVKVDRDQNAYLYVIRVNTRGKASLLNENHPIELVRFRGDSEFAPVDLPEKEHFSIRGVAKDHLEIDRTGPAGMMTLVMLSRNQPLEGDELQALKQNLAFLMPRLQRAPSPSAVQRFSYRHHQPPIQTRPTTETGAWEPLSEANPVVQTLTELEPLITPYSKHIEAVSFAVSAQDASPNL